MTHLCEPREISDTQGYRLPSTLADSSKGEGVKRQVAYLEAASAASSSSRTLERDKVRRSARDAGLVELPREVVLAPIGDSQHDDAVHEVAKNDDPAIVGEEPDVEPRPLFVRGWIRPRRRQARGYRLQVGGNDEGYRPPIDGASCARPWDAARFENPDLKVQGSDFRTMAAVEFAATAPGHCPGAKWGGSAIRTGG
jgi:hypothetical protein